MLECYLRIARGDRIETVPSGPPGAYVHIAGC